MQLSVSQRYYSMSSTRVKTLTCDGLEIPFRFIKKNNKYSYFYFNEPGIIKVHMAKRTSIRQMIRHIEQQQTTLKKRFIDAQPLPKDDSIYRLFGKTYTRLNGEGDTVIINDNDGSITIPSDHALKQFEQTQMMRAITHLEEKYQNNGVIKLSDITYNASYMISRYGSCHKQKRKIHLNLQLIHEDMIYLEYVFCHEICHLKVANHSKAFYALLQSIFPEYKPVRKALKKIRLR